MDRKELEREILEACERVAGARARYAHHCAVEDTIRSVAGYNSTEAKPYREAKELLADKVRDQAISEDRLWRAVVEGTVDRILESFGRREDILKATFGTVSDDLHNALLVDETPKRPASDEEHAIHLVREIWNRSRQGLLGVTKTMLGEIADILGEEDPNLGSNPPKGWDKIET